MPSDGLGNFSHDVRWLSEKVIFHLTSDGSAKR
jgi:hypothetical protein